MKITANLVVKNEEEYIEKVLIQVCKLADEVLIIDNGSEDKTFEIIKNFSEDIKFDQNLSDVTVLRQSLLERSKGDYIWIVDGDEIWPDGEFLKLKKLPELYPDKIAFAFTFRHFLPDGEAKHRSRSIRLLKNNCGIKWVKQFPNEILLDDKGKIICGAGIKNPRQLEDSGDILFVSGIMFEHYGGIKKRQWRKSQPKKYVKT